MNCPYPEHHGSREDGSGWWLLVAIAVAALASGVVSAVIHIVAVILTFVGIAVITAGCSWLWWRLNHRQRHVCQHQAPPVQTMWGRPALPPEQQQAIVQPPSTAPQVHNHYGISLEDLAAVLQRQQEDRRP